MTAAPTISAAATGNTQRRPSTTSATTCRSALRAHPTRFFDYNLLKGVVTVSNP